MKKTLIVGTVAYDDIETYKGNSGKILGGAGTYIALATAHFKTKSAIVSVVGGDFETKHLRLLFLLPSLGLLENHFLIV